MAMVILQRTFNNSPRLGNHQGLWQHVLPLTPCCFWARGITTPKPFILNKMSSASQISTSSPLGGNMFNSVQQWKQPADSCWFLAATNLHVVTQLWACASSPDESSFRCMWVEILVHTDPHRTCWVCGIKDVARNATASGQKKKERESDQSDVRVSCFELF